MIFQSEWCLSNTVSPVDILTSSPVSPQDHNLLDGKKRFVCSIIMNCSAVNFSAGRLPKHPLSMARTSNEEPRENSNLASTSEQAVLS